MNPGLHVTDLFGKLLCCVVFVLSTGFASLAYAKNDNVYTVARFPVEAEAKNAVEAKSKAIAQGRVEAFRHLLRRITGYSAQARLPKVDEKTIEGLIDGLSVREERNSRVKYIASLDFVFHADAVRDLLRSYSLPFIEEQSSRIMVLPVYLGDESSRLTGKLQQDWREMWSKQDLDHILTPVQLGHIKAVASPDAVKAVLAGNSQAFQQISAEYTSGNKFGGFVLAIAYPSQKQGKMMVTMVGNDEAGPLQLDREYDYDAERGTWTSDKAAHYSLQVIEGRWKIIRSEALGGDEIASAPQNILVTVIFSGFREWQQIRSKIADVPGVDKLEVGSLSARGAEISLNYPGGAERLSQNLGRYSLTLQNENGAWIMRGL